MHDVYEGDKNYNVLSIPACQFKKDVSITQRTPKGLNWTSAIAVYLLLPGQIWEIDERETKPSKFSKTPALNSTFCSTEDGMGSLQLVGQY